MKNAQLGPHLYERQRRLVAAADAQLLGRGGISRVSAASGLSRTTVHRGLRELQGDLIPDERVREAGGGRKQIKLQQPAVLGELERFVTFLRTSKWNKIEHRMFCHITANWRGKPLTSHEVIVNLIGNTKTSTGPTIQAELDTGRYPTGIQVGDEDLT